MQNNIEIGKNGEIIAENFLKNKNYVILEKNYTSMFGEIDIISQINSYIVFVEVKYRKSINFGRPMEAVGLKKQEKIKKTANHYIERNIDIQNETDFRFDVIEILGKNYFEIIHIENAFC